MDERTVKRLLITLAVAISIIMLAKFMLTRTYTHLNKASAEKKLSLSKQQATSAVADNPPEEVPTISPIEPATAASAVETSNQ